MGERDNHVPRQTHRHPRLRAAAAERPGLDLETYNDRVVSYGSPPVRYVRALMFDEPIAP